MKKLTLLLFLIMFFATQQVLAQFEVIGSTEYGRIFDITYDLKTENKLYAKTLSNHLLVSEDNGENWKILFSQPEGIENLKITTEGKFLTFIKSVTTKSAGSLCIYDLEKNEIIKEFNLPNASDGAWITAYSIYPDNHDIVLIDTNFKVGMDNEGKTFYTKDGGKNWNEIYYTTDNHYIFISDVAISPENPKKIFLARGHGKTDIDGGILISVDEGKTFTEKMAGTSFSTLSINPSNPKDMMAGTTMFIEHPEAVFRSNDDGETWTNQNIEWTDYILNSIVKVVYNPHNTNHIIILEENEIVITTDNGKTWTSHVYPEGSDDPYNYYYGTSASFNPFKEGEVFINADFYPFLSTDGGKTLSPRKKTPFFAAEGEVGIFIDKTNKNLYYGVQFGYVHRNMTTGEETPYDVKPINTFSNSSGTRAYTDSYIANRVYTFAPGFMGANFSVSNDNGKNRTMLMNLYTPRLSVVSPEPNKDIVWIAYGGGDEYTPVNFHRIDFSDTENIINEQIELPESDIINGVYIDPDNTDNVVISLGAKIYVSTDAGKNWTQITEGLEELDPVNDLILSITDNPLNKNQITISSNKGIHTSTDKGKTWTKIYDSLIHKVAHSTQKEGIILGITYTTLVSDYGIVYTVDNGETWEEVRKEEIMHIKSGASAVNFVDENIEVYAGSSDLGLIKYTIDANKPDVCLPVLSLTGNYDSENNTVTIEWTAPEDVIIDSYTISRDGKVIEEPILTPETSYKDNSLNKDKTYRYGVTVNYKGLTCDKSEEKYVDVVVSGTGISIDNTENFKIYPNPAKDHLTVSGENINRIEIYNALGQLIETSHPSNNENKISLYNYRPGIYLLKIYVSGKPAIVKNVVITG